MSRVPLLRRALQDVPARWRPGLFYEVLANLCGGGVVRLFPISLVILETILDAELVYQMLVASAFYGANLLSPAITWMAGHFRVRWLVIVPLYLMAFALFAVAISPGSPLFFTLLISLVLMLRVTARVGEMNMFRLIYPVEYVSTAVGWTRSASALSGLLLTLIAWTWLEWSPQSYWGIFWFCGVGLLLAAKSYARIPTHRKNRYAHTRTSAPIPAFLRGVRQFLSDHRFLRYEIAFFIVGIGNQMGIYLVPNLLNETVKAGHSMINVIAVAIPSLTVILTAPFWGRLLSQQTPMLARGIFSLMQCVSFVLYCYGGLTGTIWPFVIGTFLHSLSVAGGAINWLTGSLYFSNAETAALYNGVHVFLTGTRGILAPIAARMLYLSGSTGFGIDGLGFGAWIFGLCAGFSLSGSFLFFYAEWRERKSVVSS